MSILPEGGNLTPEDMQEHENQCRIRDKALRWINDHAKEIEDLAGREAAAPEKAMAQIVIMIELAASMYTVLRKEHGHPEAQATLRTAVGLIGSLLRRNGEDVRMISRIDFETLSASPGGPDVAAAVAPPQVCECDVDQDGHCDSCVKMLERFNQALSVSISTMKAADLSGKPLCRPCLRREMDPVMARFVRNDLSKLEPETAEAVLKTMFATSQSIQAMKMPLTTKAWDEVIKARPESP